MFTYVGRVAIEKNIGAFLALDLPGSKVVVGDGPARAALQRRYPAAHFVGMRHGAPLSAAFAGSDVFVFPSLTDTFGLVLLESLACGTPVAAYPVTGPQDVLLEGGPGVGATHPDLRTAAWPPGHGDRVACRAYANELFLAGLRGPIFREPGADQAWHGAGELRRGVGWARKVVFHGRKKRRVFPMRAYCA